MSEGDFCVQKRGLAPPNIRKEEFCVPYFCSRVFLGPYFLQCALHRRISPDSCTGKAGLQAKNMQVLCVTSHMRVRNTDIRKKAGAQFVLSSHFGRVMWVSPTVLSRARKKMGPWAQIFARKGQKTLLAPPNKKGEPFFVMQSLKMGVRKRLFTKKVGKFEVPRPIFELIFGG